MEQEPGLQSPLGLRDWRLEFRRRWRDRRRRCRSLRDAWRPLLCFDQVVLLQLVVERRAIHAENARRLALVAARALERLQDRELLDFRQRVMRRNHEAGLVRQAFGIANGRRQIVNGDVRPFGDDDRALDDVLELAHVSRPSVAQQRLARRRA